MKCYDDRIRATMGRHFICDYCGKPKEIPIDCSAETYGYFDHGKRYCSYTCMRKVEKEAEKHRELHPTARDRKLVDLFERIVGYQQDKKNGMKMIEAARKNGFANTCVATSTVRRWCGSLEWDAWLHGAKTFPTYTE